MRRPRLFWRIAVTYLVVVVLCTSAIGLLAVRSTRDFYLDHTENELKARAALVRVQVAPLLRGAGAGEIEGLVRGLGSASGTRITIIAGEDVPGLPLGRVLAESAMPPTEMESHRDRPEFQAALRGETGRAIRYSSTLDEDMMYVAVPVASGRPGGSGPVAVIRAAVPLATLDHALASLYWRIGLTALVVALVAALIGLYVTGRITRQVHEVEEGAKAFAAGDFSRKLVVPRTEEFASVAESLNAMADDLDEKIRTVTRERNEREAVLVSMIEGVLAVDSEDRILALNGAAARLLGTSRHDAIGHSIQEIVRNPELQRVIAATLAGDRPVEAELTLRVGAADHILQAHASLLHGEDDDGAVGAVVVLNDVTRL
ncbi:MAG: hypothetical protein CVU72_06775, partial [Deltaproteobacteria bacterium HGW-Deltaproteobacteria-7]